MDNSRPPIWIGHVDLQTARLDESEDFLIEIGLRSIFKGDDVRVLELRGGTHIVLIKNEESEAIDAPFDFMVEDIDETRQRYVTAGYTVSEMEEGNIHNSFFLTEPGGNRIRVNSTHVPDHSLV